MSIDFTVVCAGPRPDDWRNGVDDADLPFHVAIEDASEWQAETTAWLGKVEQRRGIELALEQLVTQSWGFVLRINCNAGAAEAVEICVQQAVRTFGGFFYYDYSEDAPEVTPSGTGATGAEMIATWRRLLDDEAALEREIERQAKAEYERERGRDPAGFAEAEDWSKV